MGRQRARRQGMWGGMFLRRAFFVVLVLGLATLGMVWLGLNTIDLPDPDKPSETSFVCDLSVADGRCGFDNALTRLSAEQERIGLTWDQIRSNPYVVRSVTAAEDRKFFEHGGIDPLGIGRAIYRDLRNQGVRQGGSTITQQYVKNAFLTNEQSFDRKLREAILAMKLEQRFPKTQILTNYLNQIYFGRGCYGVEAAARSYFGKSAVDLELHEAAFLAGLIRAPERADPATAPEEATRRRKTVLDAMVQEGMIAPVQRDIAHVVPWVPRGTGPGERPDGTYLPRASRDNLGQVRYAEYGSKYAVEYVRQWLNDRFGEGAAYTKGLRVYTTLDPNLQEEAYRAIYERVLKDPAGPSGAAVTVDVSGRVRALVGGRDFEKSKVNLALGTQGGGSGQPPGSTFKPFALAAFSDAGYSVRKSFFPNPATAVFRGVDNGKDWKVSNYKDADAGNLSVEQMTWQSTNTGYATLANEVGNQAVIDMAGRLGVSAPLKPIASTVLGTQDVSPLDMATGYSTFSRGGLKIQPYLVRRVEDAQGKVLYDVADDPDHAAQQVVDREVADTVNSVLTGVVGKGTGTGAAIRTVAAGKTGTTQDNKDAWFVGYTCRVTTAVWLGFTDVDEESELVPSMALDPAGGIISKDDAPPDADGVTGGSVPATIWKDIMNDATEGDEACDFPKVDAGAKAVNGRLANNVGSTTTTVRRRPNPTPASTSTTIGGGSRRTTTTDAPTTTSRPASTTTERPAPTTTERPATTTTTTERPAPTTTERPAPTTTAKVAAPG